MDCGSPQYGMAKAYRYETKYVARKSGRQIRPTIKMPRPEPAHRLGGAVPRMGPRADEVGLIPRVQALVDRDLCQFSMLLGQRTWHRLRTR
jgi:hypothetical protein